MLINHNLQNSFLKDYLYLMEFLAIALRLPFGSVGPSAPLLCCKANLFVSFLHFFVFLL